MNKEREKRPLNKSDSKTKRTSEDSCASAQYESLSNNPDLIDELLPTALEAEVEDRKVINFVSVNNVEADATEELEDTELPFELEDAKRRRLFTRFSEMSFVRELLTVVCCCFCLWSILPLSCGITGIGLYAPLLIGLFALFTVAAWDFILSVNSRLWKMLWAVIAIVATVGAVAFAFVSGHMIAASNNTAPASNSNVTVVILGCKVNGTRPSRMLKSRLDKAAEYLLTHPEVNCIVTGGAGSDEELPEAVVMKQYLVEKGVSAGRIRIEDSSESTRENIENALEVARDNNYYTTFYIVTDRFHQLRASILCDELGITSYALSCETPWYLTEYYWFREMFALAYYTLL